MKQQGTERKCPWQSLLVKGSYRQIKCKLNSYISLTPAAPSCTVTRLTRHRHKHWSAPLQELGASSALQPLPALLCLTTVTCLELGLLFTPGGQQRATAELFVNSPLQFSEQDLWSQLQTISKATEVSTGRRLLSFTTVTTTCFSKLNI